MVVVNRPLNKKSLKADEKQNISLVMQHHRNRRIQHRVVGLIPTFSYDRSCFDVDTVDVTNLANGMEQNIRLPLDVEGTKYNVNGTITAFVKLKTQDRFTKKEASLLCGFLGTIQKGSGTWRGFVENMTDDFWRKIDRLFMDIGQGYICINPEANRTITHFLSDNFTDYFETVADTADWNYPEWYLDGSPL